MVLISMFNASDPSMQYGREREKCTAEAQKKRLEYSPKTPPRFARLATNCQFAKRNWFQMIFWIAAPFKISLRWLHADHATGQERAPKHRPGKKKRSDRVQSDAAHLGRFQDCCHHQFSMQRKTARFEVREANKFYSNRVGDSNTTVC